MPALNTITSIWQNGNMLPEQVLSVRSLTCILSAQSLSLHKGNGYLRKTVRRYTYSRCRETS